MVVQGKKEKNKDEYVLTTNPQNKMAKKKTPDDCEGSCEIHEGEVMPVIIEGHGWNGVKFNYCQKAIEEDERRGFVVRHDTTANPTNRINL